MGRGESGSDVAPHAPNGEQALALPFKERVGWGWCYFALRVESHGQIVACRPRPVVGTAQLRVGNVIYVTGSRQDSCKGLLCQTYKGGLTMQVQHNITEDQATWLRMLESCESEGRPERIAIPDEVLDALVERGFARRWRDGNVTITLGGIREVAQH
jgi:hypothetical protein